MAEQVWLRRVGDPVVVAAPAGVRIRTRLRPSPEEAAALTAIGRFLGSLYRGELAERIACGVLDRHGRAVWRAQRKQALTAESSSRWAGALTRTVEDQYQLGMRCLAAHVANLRAALEVLEQRCALRPGKLAPVGADGSRSRRQRRGYRSASERFAKTRRLARLRDRLNEAEQALAAGRPPIVVGGKRLWRNRTHLEAADMSEQRWRDRWDAVRMFLIADGESGRVGGNETIRVDADGRLRIKTPAALVDQLGSHVVIGEPIRFNHRGQEWERRVGARRAVRYDISFDPERGRWYLDASWKTGPQPAPDLSELRQGPVLGVDLNESHLAGCVLDASGNPIGAPVSIEVSTAGMRASRRDGRVRAAITAMLDHAQHHSCAAIVIENLDFADARTTGRETLGRGNRGKRLRRSITGIPTRRFRDRLTAMAARRGIAVIGVDPAYTSKWGDQHWRKPLQQQTSDPTMVTGHHGAAAAIGRRGLGLAIRRRPAGPRNGQRTAAGTPPARPDRRPSTTHSGCRGSGPPAHPPRGVPVHRKTPTRRGQHRSDRAELIPVQQEERSSLVPARLIGIALVVAGLCMSIGNEPSASAAPNIAGMAVFLDPGHNGVNDSSITRQVPNGRGGTKECNTSGTQTGDGYPEHALNWAVALQVRDALNQMGVRTQMSRDDDTSVGPCVDQRAALANAMHPDAIVSIHADAGPASGRGFHVNYSSPPLNDVQTGPAVQLAQIMRDSLAAAGLQPSTYIGSGGLYGRADLAGLNLAQYPAVLVELGNMKNADEAAQMESPGGRTKYADAVTQGIVAYLSGKAPSS